ncbi:hypothetical protein [Actinobacillus equuli]|uniref:Uncharacterized protein n=1 Tax=Actinobacillus equuli TaxID=718 RepID=A0AAX3FL63_ACTEU|nr:hypothetical protein [Actinobacillus equuli]AIZ79492.1 hypothetical protein ACEE_06835 [Actinobacillus equuli subsp. equuli]WGE43606.1 hypothetical protein NYR65_06720 [Actinobacillus equuli subsp. equuli]WGE56326.1 hypothetical protein NYR71_06215 [Actinobacillus equuli subsp. equuli]VEE90058.1 Uncharacterised protein [Actinobacillus equuli]
MVDNDIIRLRISIQNALIGRITKDIRGIYIKIVDNNIILDVVVDGSANDWSEVIYEVGAEVIADFDEGYNIYEKLIRVDYPNKLCFKDHICVYKRYED